MEFLNSHKEDLCNCLSTMDALYIIDKCEDILTAKQDKAIRNQKTDAGKISLLLETFIEMEDSKCQDFLKILKEEQTHYPGLKQHFIKSTQASSSPTVHVDCNSTVDTSKVTNVPPGPECPVPPKQTEDVSSSQGPAMKIIIENKVKLIDWLRADSVFILQHVHSKRIVTDREYQELKSLSVPEAAVTDLIDKMILKKEETCSQFLHTLRESEVNDTYPELKKWITTLGLGLSRPNDKTSSISSISDKRGFLKRNRTALVSQVKNVKAIVDDLQSGGYHDEMAAFVNAQLTSQESMRKLLDSATSSGAANALIQALFTHQKDVMDDLIAENA